MTDPETTLTPEEQAAADLLSFTKIAANEQLIRAINGMTTNALNEYPQCEVQTWPYQDAEARAVIAAGENATIDMAPFLAAVCSAQFGAATDTERLTQVKEKAVTVMGYADAWRQMAAYLNGLRARTQDAIGLAETPEAVTTILNAALSEGQAAVSQSA